MGFGENIYKLENSDKTVFYVPIEDWENKK